VRKPRIFIASSVESLDVADAINVYLEHQAEVTVWKNGFRLSSTSIDSLGKSLKEVQEFAKGISGCIFRPIMNTHSGST